jgi:adenine-specific DNA-methyltransferase
MKYEDMSKEDLLKIIKEKEKALIKTKYGLNWDKKTNTDNEVAKLKNFFPVLQVNNEKSIYTDSHKPDNIIIQGDNYHTLNILSYTHKEKIDVIYIDPPYNTGRNDFMYNDSWVNEDDSYKHSKWLNFMEPRLKLAKTLLKSSGLILISINHIELAQLKMLCDNIFGENNFIDILVWDKKSSAKGVPPKNMIVNTHEYILAYQKSSSFSFIGEIRDLSTFSNPDNDPRGPWRNTNIKSTTKSKDLEFSIVNPETGIVYTDTWAYSKEELEKMIIDKSIIFPARAKGQVRKKEYFNEFKNKNIPIKSSLGLYDSQKNTEMLKQMLPDVLFLNPKPLDLMKYIIKVSADKNATILDFFAGSGTTAHAVLDLNKEDSGQRNFILVTNNEGNIMNNVCYPRIKTLIKGIRPDNSKYSDPINENLKYFEVKLISREDDEDDNLINISKESVGLICLKENTFNLIYENSSFKIFTDNGSKYTFIYHDYKNKEIKNFINKINENSKNKSVYIFSFNGVFDDEIENSIKDLKGDTSYTLLNIYKNIKESVEY